MKRSRLSRKGNSVHKVRLHAVSNEPYIRAGFADGLKKASNKHILQYSQIPDEVTRVDPLARILKDEAKREVDRRNAILKGWGHDAPIIGFPEKVEAVAGFVESKTKPVYHFYKNFLGGKFADELIRVMSYEDKVLDKFLERYEKGSGHRLPQNEESLVHYFRRISKPKKK
jgi:hypothetical protein